MTRLQQDVSKNSSSSSSSGFGTSSRSSLVVVVEEDSSDDLEMGRTVVIANDNEDDDDREGEIFFDAHQEGASHDWIRYRTILPIDRCRIQALHEEWFPVVYQEDFYDQLVLGKMCNTGDDLYTNVIVDQQDIIVGCLVGAIISVSKLNTLSRQLLLPYNSNNGHQQQHQRLFYLMTLGTVTEYRNAGLASSLVQKCIQDVIMEDHQCGAMYLHVITRNHAAIRFYERLGFWRVQEIPDYYTIDGTNHNCYLYAKYFHGNRGHLDMFKVLSWWISSLWQRFKEPLSYLVKHRAYR